MSIRVTVLDLETGDTETKEIRAGDYLLVCAEPCELAHVNAYRTGTHVLTVRGCVHQRNGTLIKNGAVR